MKRFLLSSFIGLVALFAFNTVYSQTTYTWNLAGGGSWATAGNWTPSRATPAANDILRFTNGGTKIITNVPTQTIGKLQITGNSNITLQAVNSGTPTITVSTAAADAIDVDAGSTLQIQGLRSGGTDYGLMLTTANTAGLQAAIDGTIIVKLETSNRPATLGVFTKGGSNATINFNSGSLYTHNVDGSLIPVSTWNTNATCNITGVTGTPPSNLNQSFGNFTYDCLSHGSTVSFLGALTSVNGDLTIKAAGSSSGMSGRTTNPLILSNSGNYTLNIGGDFNVDHYTTEGTWVALSNGTSNVTVNVAGDFNMSRTGTGPCFFDFKINTAATKGTHIMNVAGNFTLSGGYFDWTYETSGGTNQTILNLTGNFFHTGASTIMVTSTGTTTIPNGKINFVNAGMQTVYSATPANLAYTNFEVMSGSSVEMLSNLYLTSSTNAPWGGQFIVNGGAVLDASTYQIVSSTGTTVGSNNVFTLNPGAGFITANVNGVHQIGFVGPSISAAIALRTFSSGANYTYDGAALQNSGTFTTTPVANQVNNLTINNTAGVNTTGVTLQQEFRVASVCNFLSGVFTTTNTNILTINDNATITGVDLDAGSTKYVNGPLKKVGNDLFTFPVGKISHGCRPIYISAPSSTTDEFRAELIRGDAGMLGPITASGLQKVSGCEYWYLDRLVGTSNVTVTLSWSGESPCNAQSYVTDLPNLVVAHFNGTSWDTYGNDGGTTGNAAKGTVTWNYTGPYNTSPTQTPWSLGSLLWWTNPLTVKFINLKATEKDGSVKLEWANVAETGVDKYFIEYSIDGINFSEINNTSARRNNNDRTDYTWWHMAPVNGMNFYRVKALEFNGAITYSAIVRIGIGKNYPDIVIYPNPAIERRINIAASALGKGKYDVVVLNMAGQKILQQGFTHTGGSATMQINLPESIKAGLYSIKLSGPEQHFVKTFLIQ